MWHGCLWKKWISSNFFFLWICNFFSNQTYLKSAVYLLLFIYLCFAHLLFYLFSVFLIKIQTINHKFTNTVCVCSNLLDCTTVKEHLVVSKTVKYICPQQLSYLLDGFYFRGCALRQSWRNPGCRSYCIQEAPFWSPLPRKQGDILMPYYRWNHAPVCSSSEAIEWWAYAVV